MDINNITVISIAVVAALIIGGLIGQSLGRRQRTKKLQARFGPEYDHAVNELGDQRQAEQELAARLDHVKALDIRPLTLKEIDYFTSRWRIIQAEFVDEPSRAMQKADETEYRRMARAQSPFGDGLAAKRIADILDAWSRRDLGPVERWKWTGTGGLVPYAPGGARAD